MKTTKTLFLLACSMFLFMGCAMIFLPRKQEITFKTSDDKATVFVDNKEIGQGSTITSRIKKNGTQQIVVVSPNYKDNYVVLYPSKRPGAFYPLYTLSCLTYYGMFADGNTNNTFKYNKIQDVSNSVKLVNKTESMKYIDLTAIKLNIKDKNKDLKNYSISYSKDIITDMEKEQKKVDDNELKQSKKEIKKNGNKKTFEEEDNKIVYDDTKFSENIYKTLKKTGFVDTINKVFSDNNNTISIEAAITKISDFRITASHVSAFSSVTGFNKLKINLTWYVKNQFNEILDSIVTNEYSGEYCDLTAKNYSEKFAKMVGDAVELSYLNLHKNKTFQKHLAVEKDFPKPHEVLTIAKPNNFVKEVSDAASASVIVKNKNGHGSGFAISHDGYIITNFHVIAGIYYNKFNDIKVISDGEEYSAKIVRYNRSRDIALLKIDKSFETVFNIPTEKKYKNLLEIYTIGAPKSIELGQSVTIGLISNERKSNNNHLLQLSMSVNFGNSGGPVFDKMGNLHGVIVSKLTGVSTEGIGFALPAFLIPEQLNLKFN
jgi:S1-C subfamily serine protease